jgi:sec-independent protein translocase protein TatC
MSLFEHLGELRKRLLRSAIAILVLSVVGMFVARPLFAWLMRPVLAALPVGEKSLIYTSGIEEVNVLLKVGLYAGLSISTPIILWQLWSFISPGLLPAERRYAAPFILAGTLAFVAGAAFCYYAVLPQMFGFLLSEGQERAMHERLDHAQQAEQDALRFLRLGEAQRAGDLAHRATAGLSEEGDAQIVLSSDGQVASAAELTTRIEALGRLIDALQAGFPDTARPVLIRAMDRREEAIKAETLGHLAEASALADQAAALLGAAVTHGAENLSELWKLEKLAGRGHALMQAEQWTRPMLSMDEQLSLVLALEVAFGGIFELPLIMALLTALGLVKASFLIKYQRHALVVCLILAAVITPTGDVINLMMMCGPMVLCYELGTLASWLIERRRARQIAAATSASPTAPVEPTP